MTKTEFISAVAEKTGKSKKETAATVDAAIEVITEALKNGEKVTITGFASFETRTRSAHTAKSPSTGEMINVPEKKALKLTASTTLKDAVNA